MSIRQHLEKICLLFHFISLPQWKSVKLLKPHAKDIKEGIRRKVTLQRKAVKNKMSVFTKLHSSSGFFLTFLLDNLYH